MTIEIGSLSGQSRMALFKGWQKGLRDWVFHWKGECTFGAEEGYRLTFEQASRKIISLLRNIGISEGIQIAAFYAICRKNGARMFISC